MKILYTLLALLVLATTTRAQGDQKAKAVVTAVTEKIKSFPGVTANFRLVTKSRAGKLVTSTAGRLALRGDKYYIRQGTNEIFSDGTKVWNYNGNDEVTVTNAGEDPQGISPQAMLTGFNNNDYNAKLVSSSATTDQVLLTPTDKRKNFKQVTISVDKARNMVTKAKIVDKSDNVTDFSLSNVNTNATLSDNTFVFDKGKYKKNIEVIE